MRGSAPAVQAAGAPCCAPCSASLIDAGLSRGGARQANPADFRQSGFGFAIDMARQVLQRRSAETGNVVEQLMIEVTSDRGQHRIHLIEIAYPALMRVRFPGQRYLGIEAMAMLAPVRARRRTFQKVRGVEAELLCDLGFGSLHGGG